MLLHYVAFLMPKYVRPYGFLFHHWSGVRLCRDHRTVSWHEHMWISSSFVRSYGLFEGSCFPSDSLFLSSCDLGFGGESKWSHAPCSGLLRSQGFYFSPFCRSHGLLQISCDRWDFCHILGSCKASLGGHLVPVFMLLPR